MLSKGDGGTSSDSVFMPLTLLLRPELLKELTAFANSNKNPSGINTAETDSLFTESKEVFLNLMRGAGPVEG